jgi:predicted dehydrogenase
MSDRVRPASVGLGGWGSVLADAALAGGAEIAGGFARVPAHPFIEKSGGRADDGYDAILADPGVDGVMLATPHTTHADQIVEAAAAGKHVFCEMPLAAGEAAVFESARTSRESGRAELVSDPS